MCNDLCNRCGEPQCENICTCSPAPYTDNNCETPTDFKCVILEKSNETFPCLDFKEGDNLFELLGKVEDLKCSFDNLEVITPKDENVKTTSTDLISGFLFDKVVGNECITWTTVDLLGNIKLKPVIDFSCVLSKLITLPLFCSTVLNCVASLPPQCNAVGSIIISNITSTTLTYIIIPGLNNTSFTYSLYLDAALTSLAAPIQSTISTSVTFTGLTPSTQYWLQVQPICSNGGTTNYTIFGPQTTNGVVNPACPEITLNTPVVVNNTMSVSWTGGVGATSYNVYINNILVATQSSTSYTSGVLTNGNYTIKVEALPCAAGVPQSDSQSFVINYTPSCTPPSNVTLLTRSITNTCPSTTVNLNGLVISTPFGVTVEWHNDISHTSIISNPNSYSVVGNSTVFVFTKDTATGCYSNPISVTVALTTCVTLPSVTLNCQHNVTVLSGTFVKNGSIQNGTISIPVTVSGSGTIFGNISDNGFTGSFTQAVTPATTEISPISITYNGTGGSQGDNLILVNIIGSFISNAPQLCYTSIPVTCPECPEPAISISSITSTGFTVTTTNLQVGDIYQVTITELSTTTIIDFANNLTAPYVFTGGTSGVEYIVTVTTSCVCGNFQTFSVLTTTL